MQTTDHHRLIAGIQKSRHWLLHAIWHVPTAAQWVAWHANTAIRLRVATLEHAANCQQIEVTNQVPWLRWLNMYICSTTLFWSYAAMASI